ncbi:thioredoxin family protein [Lentibacillus sediminis]|uniref:thioredoxin family protein n=1 Tax=Lentibacillus sediminis TaxID=1940529 RepID=UPI000C1C79FC|nr:thioredoxin family protein [Lentibacillus sediminis]
MKKKMIIFGSVIVVLFAALIFVTSYQNNQQVADADNPYGTSDLEQATIDQLDDPNYQNQILPDELNETIESGEPTTVYFYSPTCVYCQQTTPDLVPLTEELGVDMVKLNLLEFAQTGTAYGIESTPTVVHYEDGEEVARITGAHPMENFQAFFEQYVLSE